MNNHPSADRMRSRFCGALRTICVLGAFFLGSPSYADTSRLPSNVQETLAQVGPGWGKDIGGNIAKTLAAFTPVLAAALRDGVTSVRDLVYGDDTRNKLDIFRRPGSKDLPVMVFIYGGAYVAGERNLNEEAYSNVPLYFARNGFLGVNATYRLAPAATRRASTSWGTQPARPTLQATHS